MGFLDLWEKTYLPSWRRIQQPGLTKNLSQECKLEVFDKDLKHQYITKTFIIYEHSTYSPFAGWSSSKQNKWKDEAGKVNEKSSILLPDDSWHWKDTWRIEINENTNDT